MSRPAPFAAAVAAQATMEARLTARRGENLLAMVGIPVVLLAYFATFGTGPEMPGTPTDTVSALIPGTLALAIVASGLVNLGIATAYERGYGVLKRLGGAPLGRSGLVAAKLGVVAIIAALQVVGLLAFAAIVLGWRATEATSWALVALTAILGVLTFAAFGLLLAGMLRPEATLVVANILFLAAIFLGGAVPLEVGGPLGALLAFLPMGALTRAFMAAMNAGSAILPLASLAAWAIIAFAGAARTFRWD